MWHWRLMWILELCLLNGRLNYPAEAVMTHRTWVYNPKIENLTTSTDLLATLTNVSRISCATRCTNMAACHSFFFTTSTGSCRLHSNRFMKGAPLADKRKDLGTRFYTDRCNAHRFGHNGNVDKYFKLKLNHVARSRDEGLGFCEKEGGTLIRVKTTEEVSAIRTAYDKALKTKTLPLSQYYGFWLDAMYDNTTGKFRWSDGTDVDFVARMWQSSGMWPDASAYCVVMLLPPAYNFKLETIPCNGKTDNTLFPLCECKP